MWFIPIIIFSVIIAALEVAAIAWAVKVANSPSSGIDEKFTERLNGEAMKQYPRLSQLQALRQYKLDLTERVIALRNNHPNSDVYYAIQSDLRDLRIVEQEIARIEKIETEINSSFITLTSQPMQPII